jgi:hypothetical protein
MPYSLDACARYLHGTLTDLTRTDMAYARGYWNGNNVSTLIRGKHSIGSDKALLNPKMMQAILEFQHGSKYQIPVLYSFSESDKVEIERYKRQLESPEVEIQPKDTADHINNSFLRKYAQILLSFKAERSPSITYPPTTTLDVESFVLPEKPETKSSSLPKKTVKQSSRKKEVSSTTSSRAVRLRKPSSKLLETQSTSHEDTQPPKKKTKRAQTARSENPFLVSTTTKSPTATKKVSRRASVGSLTSEYEIVMDGPQRKFRSTKDKESKQAINISQAIGEWLRGIKLNGPQTSLGESGRWKKLLDAPNSPVAFNDFLTSEKGANQQKIWSFKKTSKKK